MPIIATEGSGKKYPPHPADQFAARCIDVIDLGMVKTVYDGHEKEQHKVVIRFFCGQYLEGDEGPEPWFVGRRFTLSLHERGNLRPFLETWRGQKFTEAELEGFDLEMLIGAPAFLDIQHNTRDDVTYANVMVCTRLPKGMEKPPELPGYVRVCDRVDEDGGQPSGKPDEDDSDSLPF